jgi:hypothetical protein
VDCRKLTKEILAEKLGQTSFLSTWLIFDWVQEKDFPVEFVSQGESVVVWSAQTFKNVAWADKVAVFPLKAASIFKLADSFGLRQLSSSQMNLELVLADRESPEAIIGILSRQLKMIAFHLSGDLGAISTSSFVRDKVADQARLWSIKAIKRGFRALLEADLAVKSGLDPKVTLSLALSKINP